LKSGLHTCKRFVGLKFGRGMSTNTVETKGSPALTPAL
jgi:hypothetical protein